MYLDLFKKYIYKRVSRLLTQEYYRHNFFYNILATAIVRIIYTIFKIIAFFSLHSPRARYALDASTRRLAQVVVATLTRFARRGVPCLTVKALHLDEVQPRFQQQVLTHERSQSLYLNGANRISPRGEVTDNFASDFVIPTYFREPAICRARAAADAPLIAASADPPRCWIPTTSRRLSCDGPPARGSAH